MAESTDSTTETENTSWTDPILRNRMDALHNVKESLDSVIREILEVFHNHPKASTIVCGRLGFGGVMAIADAESCATHVSSYLGYRGRHRCDISAISFKISTGPSWELLV